ncbi:MAG: hypothetical protein JW894_11250 [Bacteroidales bacterium]|nr:hypothetical protein [Bacteroidales bacterium]
MKTLKRIFPAFILTALLFVQSCEFDNLNSPEEKTGILPERFKVDIPDALSNEKSAYSEKSADTLNGNAIYGHLANFIAIGEGASDIVVSIIYAIAIYDINEPMVISFQGDEDNRIKNLVVEENAEYDGRVWEYILTITDAESEDDPDGGKALQVVWNVAPIEGIAILRPYHIDRVHNREALDAKFRIEYSEVVTAEYDAYMIVEIADLPMPDYRIEPFALNSLKMFVGRKGNTIDIYGNSDHPNAQFFTDNVGFSWSFVAAGYENEDIGVAEVGLPPSTLDEDDREVLLKEYSIKNVLTREITEYFVDLYGIRPDSTDLAAYLHNADAPGFFANEGFVQGGESPGAEYDGLVNRIDNLSPYNPLTVNELTIDFR